MTTKANEVDYVIIMPTKFRRQLFVLKTYLDIEYFNYKIDSGTLINILIPYLRKKHFTLIIIDVNKQTVTKIDSMVLKAKSNEECKSLNNFLKTRNDEDETLFSLLKMYKWMSQTETRKRCIQVNGYNCGIYVIYFMIMEQEKKKPKKSLSKKFYTCM